MNSYEAALAKARAMSEGEISFFGTPPLGAPGVLTRWKLRRAERLLVTTMGVTGSGVEGAFLVAKIRERLGEREGAYASLLEARRQAPESAPLAKEASAHAFVLGRVAEATRHAEEALRLTPDSAELNCNLALAYCISSRDAEARRLAARARALYPSDEIAAQIDEIVRAVAEGRRKRPGGIGPRGELL